MITQKALREFFTRGKKIKLHDGEGVFLEMCKTPGLAKVIAPNNMIRGVPIDDLVRMNITHVRNSD